MNVNNVKPNKFVGKLRGVDVVQSAKTLATDTKGTKALTLDKKGKLTTVDLNKKNKDGKVMKFFKGMTNKAYREKYWGLEKKQKTAKDPNFIMALGQKVDGMATFGPNFKGDPGEVTPEMLKAVAKGGKAEDMKFMLLFTKLTKEKTEITPNDIANSKLFSKLGSEQFDAELGKVAYNVKDDNGDSQNIVDYIAKHCKSGNKDEILNSVKGASLQSVAVAVSRNAAGKDEAPGSNTLGLLPIGRMVWDKMDTKAPPKTEDLSKNLSVGMSGIMEHLKHMVDTGKKNGLSDQAIAGELFDYCGDIFRKAPPRTQGSDNLESYYFGDSRVTPSMTKPQTEPPKNPVS